MKIELTHPQTKQTIQVEVAEVDLPRLAEMLAPQQSPHTLQPVSYTHLTLPTIYSV